VRLERIMVLPGEPSRNLEELQVENDFMKNPVLWAKIGVAVATCFLLVWWVNWNELANTLKAADGYWLCAVFLIMHVDRIFMALKWMLLLRGSLVSISTGAVLKSYYVGGFWGLFLPASLGADAVRATWLIKEGEDGPIIVSSIVIERLLGSLALALVGVGSIVLLTVYGDVGVATLSGIVFGFLFVSTVAITALFSRSTHRILQRLMAPLPLQGVRRKIDEMKVAILRFREKPDRLIRFLMLSIFEQVFPIISTFLLAKAFSIDLPLVWAIIGVPIILAVSRMPISVNNIGVKEGAYALMFSFAGISLSDSVMMSMADRVLLLLAGLPGALWTALPSKHH